MNSIDEFHFWRQRIPLSDKTYTPGYIELNWEDMYLPDVKGKSFLDVGSNDGFIPFEAEKKGASQIVASDVYAPLDEVLRTNSGCPVEGIQLAKAALNSKVEIVSTGVYDLHKLKRTFDIVLMSNVIAWLRDPITCVEQLSNVTDETLVIRDGFIRKRLHENIIRYDVDDPWLYRPNLTFIETLLRENGFKSVEAIRIKAKSLNERYNAPWCTVKSGSRLYNNASENKSLSDYDSSGRELAIAEKNGRTLIKGHGWVESENVIPVQYRPAIVPQLIRSLVGQALYEKARTGIYDFKNDVGDYAIIARK